MKSISVKTVIEPRCMSAPPNQRTITPAQAVEQLTALQKRCKAFAELADTLAVLLYSVCAYAPLDAGERGHAAEAFSRWLALRGEAIPERTRVDMREFIAETEARNKERIIP
jgi:hypothetical protein